MKHWITADLHEGHGNIIQLCRRPFNDVEHQHEVFVKNFNERVRDEDVVYHDGDYCFRNSKGGKKGEGTTKKAADWRKDYNGTWVFIKGNHDGNNSLKTPIERVYIRYGGMRICIVHNPIHADHHCELNLVGHVHTQWKVKRLNEKSIMVNVGVDVWNFRPVSIEEIIKRMNDWKKSEKNATERNSK